MVCDINFSVPHEMHFKCFPGEPGGACHITHYCTLGSESFTEDLPLIATAKVKSIKRTLP